MTLQPFEDRKVTECAVRIVNTGDGLSESLAIAPAELELGDEIHIVLRGTVTKITFDQVKDTDELRRVHTIKATFGTIVTGTATREILDGARRAIEDASGVQRLDGIDE